jgi:hypothetical protein
VVDGENLQVLRKIRLPPSEGFQAGPEYHVLTDAARNSLCQPVLSEPATHSQHAAQ